MPEARLILSIPFWILVVERAWGESGRKWLSIPFWILALYLTTLGHS